MSRLEQYYNEEFKREGDPSFTELTPEYLKAIENTMGFAFWNFNEAVKELASEIKKQFKITKL